MARPKITLFVDILSPFGYLAFYALHTLPVFKQCQVSYVPVFLGAIMHATGNRPPLEIKNKDRWINTERLRLAALFSIPMSPTMPAGFPPHTLTLMRALTALEQRAPQLLPAAIAGLYQALWVELLPVQDADVAVPVLVRALGWGESEVRDLFEAARDAGVKKLLLDRTQAAVAEKGVFGLPWFLATDAEGREEGFWGMDHLGFVVRHLGLKVGAEPGFKALL